MISLPVAALEIMGRATAQDMRVLLWLCAARELREDLPCLCERVGCTEAEAQASIAFWRGAGVLTVEDQPQTSVTVESKTETELQAEPAEGSKASDGTHTPPAPRRTESLPRYTTEELSDLLERRREAAALIDECQRILGRIFNVREIGVLVALLDYLSLDAEYLILLCAHCAKLGKTSIHYVEKVAQDMVDGGACTVEALQETLRREDAAREAEGQIRALFGAQDRKLTQAERKYIRRWTDEWKFDMGMIELAYEATVDSIGEASMRYTDGVLKRWQAEGLTTPEAVAASDERWRQAHENGLREAANGKPAGKSENKKGGSFDVDDFFEAALKRSYQDM